MEGICELFDDLPNKFFGLDISRTSDKSKKDVNSPKRTREEEFLEAREIEDRTCRDISDARHNSYLTVPSKRSQQKRLQRSLRKQIFTTPSPAKRRLFLEL